MKKYTGIIEKECFAYIEPIGKKPYCSALTKLECEGCKFFKSKEQVETEENRRRKQR